MIRQIYISVLILIVSGCATTYYTHPTKPVSAFQADKYDCDKEAAQYARDWGAEGNGFLIADRMHECIKMKHGWVEQKK